MFLAVHLLIKVLVLCDEDVYVCLCFA
uniref:Uncharacterized protein n=1 Tax=Anguilla anguilla TaxID=7936 RepID=A0A0E9USD8_ANGAN